ncbi:MAG: hypothetical protein RL014_2092 [Pseudomonadota bacterium]
MPVFLITYTSTNQSRDIHYETEWVCDSSYDSDRARASFERQFPTAAVVRVEETQ